MEPAFEMGTVTFPFQYDVTGITVSPSPVDTSCGSTVSQMAVIVSCTDLTNDMPYTVTLKGTLSVQETLLPFTFSESFTPTSSPPPPPGLWLNYCGYCNTSFPLPSSLLRVWVYYVYAMSITMSSMPTRTSTATRPTTESPSSGELCYTLLLLCQF